MKIDFIQEPDLLFGNKETENDPRIGLEVHGPFRYEEEKYLKTIKVGIVGTSKSMKLTKKILNLLKKPIKSEEDNIWLFHSYPGMSQNTSFNSELVTSSNWIEQISSYEINSIIDEMNVNYRIGDAVITYLDKIKNILDQDNIPDVIICTISETIFKHCGISELTRGAKSNQEQNRYQESLDKWFEEDYEEQDKLFAFDFRRSLKGRLMSLKPAVPVQLLRESVAETILDYNPNSNSTQRPHEFAWNFSTALFYKANGKPWRLAKLRQDSCYIGISFFKHKLDEKRNYETSMAQIFTHTGKGLVLRGDNVKIDKNTKEPHMTYSDAKKLMSNILELYERNTKRKPSRVVIHKRTIFDQNEERAFSEVIGDRYKDFVTITDRTLGIKLLRMGKYPVLRGTRLILDENRNLLYTVGYTPRLRSYKGFNIPNPLMIHHIGDSDQREICQEILGLSKLNWNTTDFATSLPITLAFSREVGKVLSELPKNKSLEHHYRFYM